MDQVDANDEENHDEDGGFEDDPEETIANLDGEDNYEGRTNKSTRTSGRRSSKRGDGGTRRGEFNSVMLSLALNDNYCSNYKWAIIRKTQTNADQKGFCDIIFRCIFLHFN